MTATANLIMVVNHASSEAENIKELIEFMDAPSVCMATPDGWRKLAGDERIDAVFVGPDLTDGDVRALVGDIGDLDPNIPIVMLQRTRTG